MVNDREYTEAERMATAAKWVGYCRVSTDRQGRSGLGLDAQRQAILGHIGRSGGELVAEYIEVESGKVGDRPKLREALEACRRYGARLIIAKLDRLSRDVAFIANMMRSNADFIVCDLPEANKLTLHIMAAVAESEREMISKRTKEALAAARRRGVKLGKPENLSEKAARKGRKLGMQARIEKAERFAQERYEDIRRLQAEGLSLNAVARQFNDAGVLTARGGRWTATAVRNILLRTERL